MLVMVSLLTALLGIAPVHAADMKSHNVVKDSIEETKARAIDVLDDGG